MNKEKNYKTRSRIVIALLVLCLLGMGITYFFSWKEEDQKLGRERGANSGILPGLNEEQIQAEMERVVADSELAISINSELIFEDGHAPGAIRIENSAANHYLMIVEIYLSSDNSLLYKSGAIEPGYYLESDTLDVFLEKGEYPVLVKFKAYDLENEQFTGEAGANSTIIIKN